MTRLFAAAAAVVPVALLGLATPSAVAIVVGLLGLALAAVAIAARWRWAATAAAVVFLVGYAVALRIESRPVAMAPGLTFGLALLLLLVAADLAGRARGATVHGRVVGTTLARWIVLAAGALAAATLAMALATALAGALPAVASPFLAAAGALGNVLVLARLLRRAG